MHGWWIFAAAAAVVAALEVPDPLPRQARLQPVELRPRAVLPGARLEPRPSRSTSGGGRCRLAARWCSRSSSPAGSRSSRASSCSAVAVVFWVTFAAALGVLALSGHAMTAHWHLGPVSDGYFWWVLITSPEVFVFLFFMITDPRTMPETARGAAALRRRHRPAGGAPDRAAADRVRSEGRAARLAHDRLRRAAW